MTAPRRRTAPGEAILIASSGEGGDTGLQRWESVGGAWEFSAGAPADQLSSLVVHPSLPLVYGVSAIGETSSRIYCWRIDGHEIVMHAEQEGFGVDPCHLIVDSTGRLLVVTNFASGDLTVQKLTTEGTFDGPPYALALTGSSVDKERQDQAHPHQAAFIDGVLVVVDLGADVVREFEADPFTGAPNALRETRQTPVPPGSGPRHLAVLPDGRVALSGELASTLLVGRLGDAVTAWASIPSTQRTGPARTRNPRNYPGDIQASPDGRFVYLANRGYDTISTFAVDGAVPYLVSEQEATVAWPQHMLVRGDELIVAGWDSSRVVALALESGVPGAASPLLDCSNPVWLLRAGAGD